MAIKDIHFVANELPTKKTAGTDGLMNEIL